MSVLVSQRRLSKAEYVNIARELLVHTLHKAKKLPKSITFYLTVDTVKFARDCFTNCSMANGIYPNTADKIKQRTQFLQDALNDLNALESLVSILFDSYHSYVTDYGWQRWGELIEKERALIKGVMEADTKSLKKVVS